MSASIAPLSSGFDDKVMDASDCFRAILAATAKPAVPVATPYISYDLKALNPSAISYLLTLADFDTNLWLDTDYDSLALRSFLKFHTGCKIVDNPSLATFAVINIPNATSFCQGLPLGTAEYPDRAATVILLTDGFTDTSGPTFSGPGIKTPRQFNAQGATDEFWQIVQRNHHNFPCGLDWVFTSPDQIAAIPRSTKVEN